MLVITVAIPPCLVGHLALGDLEKNVVQAVDTIPGLPCPGMVKMIFAGTAPNKMVAGMTGLTGLSLTPDILQVIAGTVLVELVHFATEYLPGYDSINAVTIEGSTGYGHAEWTNPVGASLATLLEMDQMLARHLQLMRESRATFVASIVFRHQIAQALRLVEPLKTAWSLFP